MVARFGQKSSRSWLLYAVGWKNVDRTRWKQENQLIVVNLNPFVIQGIPDGSLEKKGIMEGSIFSPSRNISSYPKYLLVCLGMWFPRPCLYLSGFFHPGSVSSLLQDLGLKQSPCDPVSSYFKWSYCLYHQGHVWIS